MQVVIDQNSGAWDELSFLQDVDAAKGVSLSHRRRTGEQASLRPRFFPRFLFLLFLRFLLLLLSRPLSSESLLQSSSRSSRVRVP